MDWLRTRRNCTRCVEVYRAVDQLLSAHIAKQGHQQQAQIQSLLELLFSNKKNSFCNLYLPITTRTSCVVPAGKTGTVLSRGPFVTQCGCPSTCNSFTPHST